MGRLQHFGCSQQLRILLSSLRNPKVVYDGIKVDSFLDIVFGIH